MRAYECVLVLDPDLDEERIVAFLDRARQALEQAGGAVGAIERWGKRRLAYEIRDRTEGSYVLVRFRAEPIGGTAELQHLCRVTESVLRHLIVLEQPSASAARAEPKGETEAAPAPAAAAPSA